MDASPLPSQSPDTGTESGSRVSASHSFSLFPPADRDLLGDSERSPLADDFHASAKRPGFGSSSES